MHMAGQPAGYDRPPDHEHGGEAWVSGRSADGHRVSCFVVALLP